MPDSRRCGHCAFQALSPKSHTTSRSWMMNFNPRLSSSFGPSGDENACARSILVDPMPPPTSTRVLPLGKDCQGNPRHFLVSQTRLLTSDPGELTTKDRSRNLPRFRSSHCLAESFQSEPIGIGRDRFLQS